MRLFLTVLQMMLLTPSQICQPNKNTLKTAIDWQINVNLLREQMRKNINIIILVHVHVMHYFK